MTAETIGHAELALPRRAGTRAAGGRTRRVVKGSVDRLGAAALLLLALPLIVVIVAAISLTSRGPVLYKQRRVGRDGRTFLMWKFRTMVRGADEMVPALLARNEAHGPLFKIRRDPRVTRVGRWLRRFSLDELPQLANVLAGQMSLIGPRPALPEEVARYGDVARRRLSVKPGMTGLWQVSGRSDLAWDEALRLDLHYVENFGARLDAAILIRTTRAVLSGRGAY